MYIFLFLVKNNNKNKSIDNFLDDPMDESPNENDITTWSGRNVMHDSNFRSLLLQFRPIFAIFYCIWWWYNSFIYIFINRL